MNPIDYWYQKYLKEKLTWEDVAILITIYEQEVESGNMSRYGNTSDMEKCSKIILKEYEQLKDRKK